MIKHSRYDVGGIVQKVKKGQEGEIRRYGLLKSGEKTMGLKLVS